MYCRTGSQSERLAPQHAKPLAVPSSCLFPRPPARSNGRCSHTAVDQAGACAPVKVASLPSTLTQVACGERHTLALTRTGDVYAFGCNRRGELGAESGGQDCPLPVRLYGLPPVKAVAAAEASAAVTMTGGLLVWGSSEALGINGPPAPAHWLPDTIKARPRAGFCLLCLHQGARSALHSLHVCQPPCRRACNRQTSFHHGGSSICPRVRARERTRSRAYNADAFSSRCPQVASAAMSAQLIAVLGEDNRVHLWGRADCMPPCAWDTGLEASHGMPVRFVDTRCSTSRSRWRDTHRIVPALMPVSVLDRLLCGPYCAVRGRTGKAIDKFKTMYG